MTTAMPPDRNQPGLPDTSYYYKPDDSMVLQNKATIGLQPDLGPIIVPFTQLSTAQPWKYQSNANRPTLDLSLETQRVILKPGGEAPPPSSGTYNSLVSGLPPHLQTALAPFQDPDVDTSTLDPNIVTLHQVLTYSATTVDTLQNAGRPAPPGSPEELDSIGYSQMPQVATGSLLADNQVILPSGQTFLNQLGPNYPHYDDMSNLLGQTQASSNGIAATTTAPNHAPPEHVAAMRASTADDTGRLSGVYSNTDHGNQLQILGPVIGSQNVLAASQTIAPSNPALGLGLSVSTIGLNSSESRTGPVGSGMESVNTSVSNGLLTAFNPDATPGNAMLFQNGVALTSVVSTGVGTYAASNTSSFGYELGLSVAAHSGILPNVFGTFAGSAGFSESAQPIVGHALTALTLTNLVNAGAQANPRASEAYFDSVREPLTTSVGIVGQSVSEGIANGTITGPGAQAVSVGLTQAHLSLQNGDWEGYSSSVNNLVGQTGTSTPQVQSNMNSVGRTTSMVVTSTSSGIADNASVQTSVQRMA